MNEYLILCISLTKAQRARQILEQAGIHGRVVKAPLELNSKGCGYAVLLNRRLAQAIQILRENHLLKGKVYEKTQDFEYREVKI